MSLPDPIEMPDPLPVNNKVFDLSYTQNITPVGSGFIQTVDRGPQLWVSRYTTPPLTDLKDQAFQAFIDLLENAGNTFLGFDPRKTRPYAYRTIAGTPWVGGSGAPRIVGSDFTASTVDLDRFAVGATLTRGDMLAYLDGNIWRLHRVGTTVVADGSGLITGLKVVPRPATVSGNITLRLVKACAAMKIIGGVQKSDKVEDPGPVYTFAAVQFVNREG